MQFVQHGLSSVSVEQEQDTGQEHSNLEDSEKAPEWQKQLWRWRFRTGFRTNEFQDTSQCGSGQKKNEENDTNTETKVFEVLNVGNNFSQNNNNVDSF